LSEWRAGSRSRRLSLAGADVWKEAIVPAQKNPAEPVAMLVREVP